MIHFEDKTIREAMYAGTFGLEREALRVLPDGTFAKTPHPFPATGQIVRDFCENQTEINTASHDSIAGVLEELGELDRQLKDKLNALPEPELLWPFSNPPYIRDESDIPIAQFEGELREKTEYRNYLSTKYGRYKMTFSGIHFNFSFHESLLQREYELRGGDATGMDYYRFKDRFYLDLAQALMEYGWLLMALTAASPLLDASFLDKGRTGETVFSGMASCRCSEWGYWNDFVPVLSYEDLGAYSASIQKYIDKGLLVAPSELYYPVRLKSKGANDLNALAERGVSHIEFRMLDLNPLAPLCIEEKDLLFAHLLMLWAVAGDVPQFTECDQHRVVSNLKRAAHYDLSTVIFRSCAGDGVSMERAGRDVLEQMIDFFRDAPEMYREALAFEYEKLTDPAKRYAAIIKERFGADYVRSGLRLAEERR